MGLTSPYLMTTVTIVHSSATPIVRSRTYKFRYRAKNCVGWGTLSEELHVLAADVPQAPPPPTRSTTSATSITLLLYPATDNGGSPAANYHLLRNDGEGGAIFAAISAYNYSAHGFQHTVVLASESMTAGKHYQFVYRAENIVYVFIDSAFVTY